MLPACVLTRLVFWTPCPGSSGVGPYVPTSGFGNGPHSWKVTHLDFFPTEMPAVTGASNRMDVGQSARMMTATAKRRETATSDQCGRRNLVLWCRNGTLRKDWLRAPKLASAKHIANFVAAEALISLICTLCLASFADGKQNERLIWLKQIPILAPQLASQLVRAKQRFFYCAPAPPPPPKKRNNR